MGCPSIITANENIEAVQSIVMRNRQISIRRLAEESTIIHEIMNNYMGMKKVCTRWGPKFFTPIQSPFRVHCVVKSSCNKPEEIQPTFLIAS